MISEEELPSVLAHMREEIKFLDEFTVDMLKFITSMQEHKKIEEINLQKFLDDEVFIILEKRENIVFINGVKNSFIIKFNKMDLKKSGYGLGLSIVNNLCHNNKYKCYLHSSHIEKTIFNIKPKEEIK